MLAPDYQEFANWPAAGYPWQYRDLPFRHRTIGRNRANVARLPRRTAGTKAELLFQNRDRKDRFGTFPKQATV